MSQNLNKGNLYQAASRANLNESQRETINSLSEMYSQHKRLSGLPTQVGQYEFSQLDSEKQKAMAAFFGQADDQAPQRGFIGQAAYIISRPVVEPIKAVFKAAGWASDQVTRAYRTGAIAIAEGTDVGSAFKRSGATGEMVFNPDRIEKAIKTYGKDRVYVAQLISAGKTPDQIFAMAQNDEQKRLATGIKNNDPLMNEAVAKVNAAKYSPGRQLANLFLPDDLEGKSGLYTWISGSTDAAFRIVLDPTLLLGKARKMYLAGQYALTKTAGTAQRVEDAFNKPGVARFWEDFADAANQLRTGRKTNNAQLVGEAKGRLERLNRPMVENGVDDALIRFADEDFKGVLDVNTVKQYLSNWDNVKPLFSGQAGYKVKIMPRLSPVRKAKLDLYTKGARIFDLNKDSSNFLRNIVFDPAEASGELTLSAAKASILGKEAGAATAERINLAPAIKRFSVFGINKRLDNFSRKFAIMPDIAELMNVASDKSVKQFQRYSTMIYGRYTSRILTDIYQVGSLAERRQMATGLQMTVGTLRGLPGTPNGRRLLDQLGNLGRDAQYMNRIYDADNPAGHIPAKSAIYPRQLSENISFLTPDQLDKYAARDGFLASAWGAQYSKTADDITSTFVTGTLAGPRFPVRNAIEDYIFYLVNGDGVIGGAFKTARNRRLATKIRTASPDLDLGMVNRLVRKDQKNQVLKELNEITKGNKLQVIDGEDVITKGVYKNSFEIEQAKRQVVAKVLLDRKFTPEQIKSFGSKYNQYVEEFAMYGNFENILREASESAYNLNTGSDIFSKAKKINRKHGRVVDFEFNGEEYKKAYGSFVDTAPTSLDGKLTWAFQIAANSKDEFASEGMKLLAKHGDDRAAFVDELSRFIDSPDNARWKELMDLYTDPNFTSTQHATFIYQDLRALFGKQDGSLNKDFLKKFIQTDEVGTARVAIDDFNLDWLPTAFEDLPRTIVGPRLMPAAESGNLISDLVTRYWDWMGEANARFSRDQIVLDAAFDIRKTLEPMLQDLTPKIGKDNALRQVVALSEELAVERTLAFVDNPAVRSQMAWSMRNFARFYRATEDAYRRLYRTTKYNPEALQKIALTYEGIAHSGFVQRDDQGEPYFIYPGIAPVYAAVNKALSIFGLGDKFIAPMPLQFGSQIKMLTPSANPESWLPTFSGPLSGLALKTVYNIAGLFGESEIPVISALGKEIKATEKYTIGSIGENQSIWQAILPGHVNRALTALSRDERDSQYASAFRKAVTYLEAAGLTPSAEATAGELADYQKRLRSTISTILTTRFVLGFITPASPTTSLKSDMEEWVRENGRMNFKQVYSNLIQEYSDKGDPDPVGSATADWIKFYPDQVPYMVNESDPVFQARFKTSNAAANWVEQNKELVDAFPEGAAFLIPQSGTFSWDAYEFLKDNGYRENKLVGDFLKETFVAKSKQFYYQQQDKYEEALATARTDDEKRRINEAWREWSSEFKATRPLLQEDFAMSAVNQPRRLAAYADLKKMLNETNIQANGADKIRQMIQIYEEYLYNITNLYTSRSERDIKARETLRIAAVDQLKEIAASDANANSAYDVLFSNFLRED